MAEKNGGSKSVISNYLIIEGLYTLSTSLIWGVNTLFLLKAGLDIFGVFIANSVFTGSMALFEIPTGVIADSRGRRISFLLSVTVLFIGTIGYVGAGIMGGDLLLFCLMSVILGLGFTFYSGAVEAWLVDALNETGYKGNFDRVFARGEMVSGVAMVLGSIGGGILGNFDLTLPFIVRAGFLIAAFIVAYFTMFDLGFTPNKTTLKVLPSEMRKLANASITYGLKMKPVRLLIIAALINSIFLSWGYYAWQPYFLELLGQNLIWIAGVVAAFIALATIIGNSLVEWFTRYCGKRTTLLLWSAAIHTIAAIGVGLAGSFWLAVSLYLIVMCSMGVWGPVRQAYMHMSIPSKQRASVVSFDSLCSSIGSMFGQVGLGKIAQTQSIASGYVIGGFATIFALPVVFSLRKLKEPTDLIFGTAGKHGPCAAQGLPNVSAFDPNTHVITISESEKFQKIDDPSM